MSTEKKKITVFKVAPAYIGTIVGAGFTSGQEVMQFFIWRLTFNKFGLFVS